MHPSMLSTALIEDLNRLACSQEQDRHAADPARAREALQRLRWIDASELERFRRSGWLRPQEADLVERVIVLARERLAPLPEGFDPIQFTRGDPGWQVVRERARELLYALDAFVDLGVPGWGPGHSSRSSGGEPKRSA